MEFFRLGVPLSVPLSVPFRQILVLAACLSVLAGCGGKATAINDCPKGQFLIEGNCMARAQIAGIVQDVVRDSIQEYGLRSVIVGVDIQGQAILTQAWGESAAGEPATVDMHWRNGAIAIAYLSTAMLQLQDQGVLTIEDKLAKWLPHYPRASDITLAMLANSTSGYADYVTPTFPAPEDVNRQWTPDELIAIGLSKPMVCEPGTCFSYAHTNFVILGRVLSMASRKPLATLFRTGILDPLGLQDTHSESTPFIPSPVLHAFGFDRGTYEESTKWDPSWTLGEGEVMTSNIPDVLRSAIAIGTGSLISPTAYAQMLEPRAANLPGMTGSYYGLGVLVVNSWILQPPFFFGYSGVMAYLSPQKMAIALTSTLGPASPPDINMSNLLFQRIAQRLTPSYAPPPITPAPPGT